MAFDKTKLETLVKKQEKLGELASTLIEDPWSDKVRLELGEIVHGNQAEYLGGVNPRTGENMQASSPDELRAESTEAYSNATTALADESRENAGDLLKKLSDEQQVNLALQSNDIFYRFSQLQSSQDPIAVVNMKQIISGAGFGGSYRLLKADRGTTQHLFDVYVGVERSKESEKAGLGNYEQTKKGVEFVYNGAKAEKYITEHLEKAGFDIKDKDEKKRFKDQVSKSVYVTMGRSAYEAVKKK